MALYPYEQRQLDGLDGELRADEPGLASKFDVFARLAREDGNPPVEGRFIVGGRWRNAAYTRRRVRRHLALLLAIMLAILALITILGFT